MCDARLWRARFAVAVATQRHVYGYPPADARRRGYFDVLVEWTEADPELRTLPSSEAEPLARAALEALGIYDPRARGRREPHAPLLPNPAWPIREGAS